MKVQEVVVKGQKEKAEEVVEDNIMSMDGEEVEGKIMAMDTKEIDPNKEMRATITDSHMREKDLMSHKDKLKVFVFLIIWKII
jgi:hypothetical protein